MSKLYVAMGDGSHVVNIARIEDERRVGRTGSINAFDDDDDVIDDDDVELLGGVSSKPESHRRSDMLRLPRREAEKILTSLDDASIILQQRLDHLYTQRRNLKERLSPPSTRCQGARAWFKRIFKKFTGAKVMAATILLQLLCLVLLTLVDNIPREESSKKKALQIGSIGMMILQTANLVVIIIISGQLVAQVQARHVRGTMLLQSYIATILLFAGIYTATFRMSASSWKFVEETDTKDPDMVVTTYTRFLFYSVSTATLCGGADALPKEWYTCIFSSCQMLLSFMYFTSVIGTAIRYRTKPSKHLPPLPEDDLPPLPEDDVLPLPEDRLPPLPQEQLLETLAKYSVSRDETGRR